MSSLIKSHITNLKNNFLGFSSFKCSCSGIEEASPIKEFNLPPMPVPATKLVDIQQLLTLNSEDIFTYSESKNTCLNSKINSQLLTENTQGKVTRNNSQKSSMLNN